MLPSENRIYKFDNFLVDIEKKALLKNGITLDIKGKTFETLVVLIERREKPVSREDLMQILWPHNPVEDSNLDKHISKLREAFNDDGAQLHKHIKTFARFGYQFVASVEESVRTEPQPQVAKKATESNLETKFSSQSDISRKVNAHKLIFILLVIVSIITAFIFFKVSPRPEILYISPAIPPSIIGDQPIEIYGNNFQPGLSVEIFFPNQNSGILKGTQIKEITPNSFILLSDFNGNVGNYAIQVKNPWGPRSNLYKFELMPYNQSPIIDIISPISPEANKKLQSVFVYGCNFQNGIIVEMTFPNGESKILQGDAIRDQTRNAFRMIVYFDGRPGEYKIQAKHTGNNKRSNVFNFIVR